MTISSTQFCFETPSDSRNRSPRNLFRNVLLLVLECSVPRPLPLFAPPPLRPSPSPLHSTPFSPLPLFPFTPPRLPLHPPSPSPLPLFTPALLHPSPSSPLSLSFYPKRDILEYGGECFSGMEARLLFTRLRDPLFKEPDRTPDKGSLSLFSL